MEEKENKKSTGITISMEAWEEIERWRKPEKRSFANAIEYLSMLGLGRIKTQAENAIEEVKKIRKTGS